MKHYALDTSFIINFLKGKKSARDFYKENKTERSFLPSPVYLEAKRGVEDLEKFEMLETLPFQKEEGEEALKIINHLRDKGEMMGLIDVMIASIAANNSLRLATYDTDFEKLKDYQGLGYNLIGD